MRRCALSGKSGNERPNDANSSPFPLTISSSGAHGSPLDILVEDIVKEPIPADSMVTSIADEIGLGFELDEDVVDPYRVG